MGAADANVHCIVCGETCVGRSLRYGAARLYACPKCGFERLWPDQTTETAAVYDENYFKRWGDSSFSEAVRRTKIRTFDRLLRRVEKYSRPGRVLDVGCAKGYFLEAAAERGWDVYGIDINANAVREAPARFSNRVQAGQLEALGPSLGQFDALTATDVIEHIAHPKEFLAACKRSLSPGGILVLTTVDTDSLSRKVLARLWPHYKPEHICYYNPDNLSRILAQSGLRVTACWHTVKILCPGYIFSVLAVEQSPVLGRLAGFLQKACPAFLKRIELPLLTGEFTVVAEDPHNPKSQSPAKETGPAPA